MRVRKQYIECINRYCDFSLQRNTLCGENVRKFSFRINEEIPAVIVNVKNNSLKAFKETFSKNFHNSDNFDLAVYLLAYIIVWAINFILLYLKHC